MKVIAYWICFRVMDRCGYQWHNAQRGQKLGDSHAHKKKKSSHLWVFLLHPVNLLAFLCAANLTEVKYNNEMKHETDFTHMNDHMVLKSNNKTCACCAEEEEASPFFELCGHLLSLMLQPDWPPKLCLGATRSGKPIIIPCTYEADACLDLSPVENWKTKREIIFKTLLFFPQ